MPLWNLPMYFRQNATKRFENKTAKTRHCFPARLFAPIIPGDWQECNDAFHFSLFSGGCDSHQPFSRQLLKY